MVEAIEEPIQNEEEAPRQSFVETVRNCNRLWVTSFNLEKTMTDSVSNNLDFDELQAFVELVTKDQQSILALGNWDPR